ncbi:MAG: UDP-N-acetylglucosamine--N-acetylmuramyl-(pentapeptide) pyrophosphoryl-undecaprenol N-acetylglucosamine transferase, partial [Bartonella sp.]|nr:UDP-N-acetylglucosamine--N-acetylmuramyl-(pentapeptide) pyrophosphoryl-undecaprenol N-acetylglucosamine transferase [Bartonella sp.]
DHDQAENAAKLSEIGGAQIIVEKNLDTQILASLLTKVCCEPHLLEKQARSAKKVGQPHATVILANMVEALILERSLLDIKKELFDENAA